MPSRWELVLPGLEPGGVRLEHLHAAVSTWFDTDGEHYRHDKPYTVSPPRLSSGGPVLEIGLLHDRLANRLLTVAAPGARVRLGRNTMTFCNQPRQAAAVAWEQLAERITSRAWCLRFDTPTTFRRGNRFTPAPSIKSILGSLRRSWQAFAPPSLATLHLDLATDPAWITDIDVASEVQRVNGRITSGFVGRIRFECDADDETAAIIDRLVRLAPFSGVGAYTTRGFGVTRVEPTWTPRRT